MSYLEELLPEFRKGAKIRQNDWDKDVFIYFDKDEIYWKDSKIASTKDLVSIFTLHDNNWEFYQEPIDWDSIIKNKCLCWFWDDEEFSLIGTLIKIGAPETLYKDYKYKSYNSRCWKHCRPVRRDEVTFYKERKYEI